MPTRTSYTYFPGQDGGVFLRGTVALTLGSSFYEKGVPERFILLAPSDMVPIESERNYFTKGLDFGLGVPIRIKDSAAYFIPTLMARRIWSSRNIGTTVPSGNRIEIDESLGRNDLGNWLDPACYNGPNYRPECESYDPDDNGRITDEMAFTNHTVFEILPLSFGGPIARTPGGDIWLVFLGGVGIYFSDEKSAIRVILDDPSLHEDVGDNLGSGTLSGKQKLGMGWAGIGRLEGSIPLGQSYLNLLLGGRFAAGQIDIGRGGNAPGVEPARTFRLDVSGYVGVGGYLPDFNTWRTSAAARSATADDYDLDVLDDDLDAPPTQREVRARSEEDARRREAERRAEAAERRRAEQQRAEEAEERQRQREERARAEQERRDAEEATQRTEQQERLEATRRRVAEMAIETELEAGAIRPDETMPPPPPAEELVPDPVRAREEHLERVREGGDTSGATARDEGASEPVEAAPAEGELALDGFSGIAAGVPAAGDSDEDEAPAPAAIAAGIPPATENGSEPARVEEPVRSEESEPAAAAASTATGGRGPRTTHTYSDEEGTRIVADPSDEDEEPTPASAPEPVPVPEPTPARTVPGTASPTDDSRADASESWWITEQRERERIALAQEEENRRLDERVQEEGDAEEAKYAYELEGTDSDDLSDRAFWTLRAKMGKDEMSDEDFAKFLFYEAGIQQIVADPIGATLYLIEPAKKRHGNYYENDSKDFPSPQRAIEFAIERYGTWPQMNRLYRGSRPKNNRE